MRRRDLLTTVVLPGLLSATSGCLGGGSADAVRATRTPVDLSGDKRDDNGGMVIGKHGGPNGQIFYVDNTPDGHENPAWFHTLSFGLFPYFFRHRQLGWEAEAIYATDYSAVDYTISSRDGQPVISAPTAPGTFGNARELRYVAGSDIHGGMGPDLIPFSNPSDLQTFIDDHGGRSMAFGDLTPEFLSQYVQR